MRPKVRCTFGKCNYPASPHKDKCQGDKHWLLPRVTASCGCILRTNLSSRFRWAGHFLLLTGEYCALTRSLKYLILSQSFGLLEGQRKAEGMKQSGSFMVLAAAVCWGTTGTAQAFAPDGAQPAIIGALRLVIGSGLLFVFAHQRGALQRSSGWPITATIIAALSMAAYQLMFFAGVAKTGVAVGTIVGIGSSPILAGLLGFLVRAERPGIRWGVATALAVIGCGLLIAAGSQIRVDVIGVALAIGAGLSYAIFTVASKQLLESRPPEAVMAITFGLGALLLAPFFFTAADLSWLLQPRGIAVGLHLGLVTVAVAYTLFARGLRLVPVATAATLTLAEPLTAGALGIFVLREPLTISAALGIALIFAGLVVLSIHRGLGSATVEESI